MRLDQTARYLIRTETSTYVIDTGAMRACRRPGGAGVVPGQGALAPVHKKLFTDGAPLMLAELPEVNVGHPMELRIVVPNKFLDHQDEGPGTPLVTTTVMEVTRLG
jgi:hypothetical protein